MHDPIDPVVWTRTTGDRTLNLVYVRKKNHYVAYLECGEDIWAICLFTHRGEVLTWPITTPGLRADESSCLMDAVHEITCMADVHEC